MARIFFGQAFAKEDMAEMGIAVGAADFGASAISISQALHGTREIIIECRPTATRIEFRPGIVEGRVAAAAEIGAGSEETVVLAGKRGFGPLSNDHASFISIECVPSHIGRV